MSHERFNTISLASGSRVPPQSFLLKGNNMSLEKNITGQKFGKLTALNRSGTNKKGQAIWLFICDCGNKTEKLKLYVTRGATSSCGCFRSQLATCCKKCNESKKSITLSMIKKIYEYLKLENYAN